MTLGGRIPEEVINELRDKCDIVDYISRYVSLKKRGSNYVGLCPFHKEKTPSFVVSREKKIFHCFGCGEGGSLFNFLSRIESKSFAQVIKELAQEKGIHLESDIKFDETESRKNRLTAICYEAMKYYNESLYTDEGANCLSYLKNRGITENLIIEHNLGYSPQNSEILYKKLLKLGFDESHILDSGIFTRNQGRIQDRFSKRLVIPLIDPNKKTIGFAGRTLEKEADVAKYINSPESEIYRKSSFLFGLNIASRHIQKQDYIIIVEGYFDLISLNGINVYNVVATCGTALTKEHIRLLRQYTKNIFLCFDGDSAGRSAIYKAARSLIPAGFNIYVIPIPNNEDPDSFAQKNGHKAFEELLKNRIPFIHYLANDFKRVVKNRPDMRAQLIKRMIDYVQLLPDILEQRESIRIISRSTGIEEDIIYSYLKGRNKGTKEFKPLSSDSPYKSYEAWLVAILMQFPILVSNLPEDIMNIVDSPDISTALKEIMDYESKGAKTIPTISNSRLLSMVTEIIMNKTFPENESEAFDILRDCLQRMQIEHLKKEIKEIDKNISSAKLSGDERLVNNLIKKRLELSKSIQLREIKYG